MNDATREALSGLAKARITREEAEEYTQSLGQICGGSYRQIALAKRLGIPQALGLETEQWVRERLGGYIRLTIDERREAVTNLTAEGHSTREVGEILGVSNATVSRDATNVTEARKDGQTELDIEPSWSSDELARKAGIEDGKCVVANMRNGCDTALIKWAKETGRFVRIDRTTAWGNPFEMPDDGTRADVVGKFAKFYFPNKDGLLAHIDDLRGKVLGCWCYPEDCHGDIIAEVVNREANGDGSAGQLADEIAEIDG